MRYLKILPILLFIFSSCSIDDKNEEPKHEFSFYVNGELTHYSFNRAFIDGSIITLRNNYDDYFLKFSKDGKLGKMDISIFEFGVNRPFYSYNNFNSHFFDFQLISYDEVNKRVRAQFAGYLYNNPEDRNSEGKYVNGSFDLPVETIIAPLGELHNKTKINGLDWETTYHFMKKEIPSNYHNLTLHTLSNDEYKIMISFNRQNTPLGSYSFDENSITHKVQLAKFDLGTNSYAPYNCSGNLTITGRVRGAIKGNYTFTAVNPTNPSEVIQVTNGEFFLDYSPTQ